MPTEGRTATTLAGPRRCAYCGHRCHGRTCEHCADLGRAERAAVTIPKPRRARATAHFRATCPKCGEYAKPGRKYCALCRTPLYPSDAFLRALSEPAKGKAG